MVSKQMEKMLELECEMVTGHRLQAGRLPASDAASWRALQLPQVDSARRADQTAQLQLSQLCVSAECCQDATCISRYGRIHMLQLCICLHAPNPLSRSRTVWQVRANQLALQQSG